MTGGNARAGAKSYSIGRESVRGNRAAVPSIRTVAEGRADDLDAVCP